MKKLDPTKTYLHTHSTAFDWANLPSYVAFETEVWEKFIENAQTLLAATNFITGELPVDLPYELLEHNGKEWDDKTALDEMRFRISDSRATIVWPLKHAPDEFWTHIPDDRLTKEDTAALEREILNQQ